MQKGDVGFLPAGVVPLPFASHTEPGEFCVAVIIPISHSDSVAHLSSEGAKLYVDALEVFYNANKGVSPWGKIAPEFNKYASSVRDTLVKKAAAAAAAETALGFDPGAAGGGAAAAEVPVTTALPETAAEVHEGKDEGQTAA